MNSSLMPGDDAFHHDKQFIADLAALNEQVSRYVLRYLDADAGRTEPIDVADEQGLAETLAALAYEVRKRAIQRATTGSPPLLEGDATLRRLTNGRPSER